MLQRTHLAKILPIAPFSKKSSKCELSSHSSKFYFSEMGNFSFLATISEFMISVEHDQILVFDEVRINEGNNYNPSNGQYTG